MMGGGKNDYKEKDDHGKKRKIEESEDQTNPNKVKKDDEAIYDESKEPITSYVNTPSEVST